jgi:hypothetical protein
MDVCKQILDAKLAGSAEWGHMGLPGFAIQRSVYASGRLETCRNPNPPLNLPTFVRRRTCLLHAYETPRTRFSTTNNAPLGKAMRSGTDWGMGKGMQIPLHNI